jgi:hypothetical protein
MPGIGRRNQDRRTFTGPLPSAPLRWRRRSERLPDSPVPFGGSRTAIAAPPGSLPMMPALVRLAAPRSLHNRTERGAMGSPRVMTGRAFALVTIAPPDVPRRFSGRVHAPSSQPPLQSATTRHLPPEAFGPSGDDLGRRKRLPWGSDGPSSRRQPAGATCRRERPLSLLRSVLGVPPALDGLLPDWPCGFVSPRSRVQGSRLPGACPSRGAVPAFTGRCLLAVATCRPAVSRARRPTTSSEALLPASSAVTGIDG